MNVEAQNREEAVSTMQAMMDANAIAEHMAKMHKGEPVLAVSVVHAGIAKDLQPAF